MPKGDHLGEFEQLVMLALLRLKGDAYGMRVRREIQSRTERSVSIGSVYATLQRLERKGYVRSSISEPEPVPGGRARKFFSPTRDGGRALLRTQESLRRMTAGLSVRGELEAL